MSAESYPPADKSHLVRRVSNEEASNIRRDWTGNEESKRNHNEHVPPERESFEAAPVVEEKPE